MEASVVAEIEQLPALRVAELLARYKEVFGQEPHSTNKEFLVRRIAWQLQALAEGGLNQRARQRAAGIVCEGDLRMRFSKAARSGRFGPDGRIPVVGSELRRRFGDRDVVVKVLPRGFEYNHRRYRSLSAIAREVTGTRWNGLLFFGLTVRRRG